MHLDIHYSRYAAPQGAASIAPTLIKAARMAEAIGLRTLSLMDHLFQLDEMGPIHDPMLEGYTTLGFIAGQTATLRLRLLVSGVTYRPPGALAKIVTTLDNLSLGRAELGIGAAWYEREHLGLGIPFPSLAERFERLEEALQICLQMWSDNDGPYEGRHYKLAETICAPLPMSDPRPRIMIGGMGEKKTLRLVAQYGDACNLYGASEEVAHKIDVLRRHCDAVGRNIADIEVSAFLSARPGCGEDEILRSAEEFARLGVATVMTSGMTDDPAGALEKLFGPVMERLRAIEPAPL